MKIAIVGLASMFLIANFVSPLVFADRNVASTSGPSAKGKFEIRAIDGNPARDLEFTAIMSEDGSLNGEAVFKDAVTEGPAGEAPTATGEKPLYLKADLDCLVVKSNKAIMSGSITQSSLETYLGRRILLVVQDNGGSENPLAHDKVTWGVYRPLTSNWPAKDAERSDEDDSGPLTWLATDSERPEDEGTVSEKNQVVGCRTFPLSSFSFVDTTQGRGTVRVHP
jgi:hypothetical protein